MKYQRKTDAISGQLHDQLVMIDIDKGQYFALNTIGTRIWELIEDARTIEEICALLLEEFDVDPNQCKTDVEEYLEEMKSLDLITVTE